MRAIVTGGAGFIGSNLVDELIKRGDEVVVLDNLSTGDKANLNPKARFHNVDICNYKDIAPLFKGVDFVFHLAALARVPLSIEKPKETHDVNVNGTLNVLLAAKDAGVKRVVYSCSSSVYGNQKVLPVKESAVVNPMSPYGLQKLIGENYCRQFSDHYGLATTSLRYFNVYGPRMSQKGGYVAALVTFLRQKAAGEPLTVFGDGEQTRDFTHVSDVVSANILAAESEKQAKAEVFNVAGGKNISINTLAKFVSDNITHLPARPGEPRDSLADTSHAKEVLGWQPKVNIEEGIARLV